MARQGSGGNVLAALASLVVPGLGQLLQGRILPAVGFFFGAALLWAVMFGEGACLVGWIVNAVACVDAARWEGRG